MYGAGSSGNVIIDITFPRRPFVISQSCCEVSASLSNLGGSEIGAIVLINRSLLVPRFVLVFNVV